MMYTYWAKLLKVVDGDTFDFLIELGFHIQTKIRVRLLDLDTPEVRGPEKEHGLKIKKVAEDWFAESNGECFITTKKTGKYGRWLAVVFRDKDHSTDYLHWQLSTEMEKLKDGEEETELS